MSHTDEDVEGLALGFLDIIERMVRQHCNHTGDGVYDSGFIRVNADAMDILVTFGVADYTTDTQPSEFRWREIKIVGERPAAVLFPRTELPQRGKDALR